MRTFGPDAVPLFAGPVVAAAVAGIVLVALVTFLRLTPESDCTLKLLASDRADDTLEMEPARDDLAAAAILVAASSDRREALTVCRISRSRPRLWRKSSGTSSKRDIKDQHRYFDCTRILN